MNLEKIKVWLKNPYNILLLIILGIAFYLRFKYYNLNPVVWWDEAEYLSTAKKWAFNIPYDVGMQRTPLMPLLSAILLKLGATETILRFILVLLPSFFAVLFLYKLGKEMYNKIVGLTAASILTVFWVALFNTNRFHTDMLSYLLWILSIYFFWKGYVKKESSKYLWLMSITLALSILQRPSSSLVIPLIIIYLLLTEKLNFLKNKNLWIALLIFIMILSPYLIYSYITTEKIIAFSGTFNPTQESFNFGIVTQIWNYLYTVYLIIFIISLATLYKLIIGFDMILKNKAETEQKADLITILTILVTLSFFIFYIRNVGDERWMLLMSVGLFLIIGKGVDFLFNTIKKYNKYVAILACIGLIVMGAYQELKWADTIINLKKDSYFPVKLAALWMKERSQPQDVIISASVPQNIYYSERYTYGYPPENEINDIIKKYKPKYFVVSVFEKLPEHIIKYPEENKNILKQVNGYTDEQGRPILIIYEFVNYPY